MMLKSLHVLIHTLVLYWVLLQAQFFNYLQTMAIEFKEVVVDKSNPAPWILDLESLKTQTDSNVKYNNRIVALMGP